MAHYQFEYNLNKYDMKTTHLCYKHFLDASYLTFSYTRNLLVNVDIFIVHQIAYTIS